MLFNSLEYIFFFPVVFLLYWLIFSKKLHYRNLFIVLVSYFFYGWWDWRFLSLLVLSSFCDYFIALQIQKASDKKIRKVYLWLSLLINLGILGVFKYYNFFQENLSVLFNSIGFEPDFITLNIVLPVGISFYTFQTLSYTIDVYRKKLIATKNILAFFAYVSFFPQLVAGPIERAKNLLPQFLQIKTFNLGDLKDGSKLILLGFFKKVVIADSCAPFVNEVFNAPHDFSSSSLIVASAFFAFQIYGDFSGYSDIAIGTSKLLGFRLETNFAYPYFSRDIAEFWRRWHISLSSWFKDYIYIPLGGSKGGKLLTIRNVFIIFLVSGFWHGANWTYIIWGGLNAAYFLPLYIFNLNRQNLGVVAEDSLMPSFKELFQIFSTFFLTCLAWIFFRAASVSDALVYLKCIIWTEGENSILMFPMGSKEIFDFYLVLLSLLVLIYIEWKNRTKDYGLQESPTNCFFKLIFYFYLINEIIHHFFSEEVFIYFQF